ncbi:MAG: ArsC family transcriptional regulator [Clostridiales bacterium]|jgi:arsenate reductase-like glutaredoxin family protein|nr:ArsC family transcriptional regulator [Clostridiales bacterium]
MNIQIFGKQKCFDTKKAERYFKERRIRYQYIDLKKMPMSRGEFQSIKAAAGLKNLIDERAEGAEILRYLAFDSDREEKIFDNQALLRTPVVRNGRKATVGYAPEVWDGWD